jgi:hypothetical protein
MKTTFATASFALIVAVSGLSSAHAGGFNDRTAIPTVTSTRAAPQDLRHFPVVHGFNQQSHHAEAASRFPTRATDRTRATAGVHCDLVPRFGFQNSSSFASC